MRKRSLAREFALKILYQMDISRDKDAEQAASDLWASFPGPVEDEVKDFTAELAKGVVSRMPEVDKKISAYAANWQMGRMAVIDRNILRLAAYEIIFRQDIPPKVSINEAIELAKKYSGIEASKFINGILDKIKSEKTEQSG